MSREFDADYWEDHYRRHEPEREGPDTDRGAHGQAGPRPASPQLVTVAEGLTPGRVLDAGCGEGADVEWLAARGWRVTAVDVASTALRRAQEAMESLDGGARDRVDWVQADLSAWAPEREAFDLVSAQYVHVPEKHRATVFGRLAAAVAPGGTLLIVDHDPEEHGTHDHDHDHAPQGHDQSHDHRGAGDPNAGDPSADPHGAGDHRDRDLDDSERPHPRLSLTAPDLVAALEPALWEIRTEATPDVVLRARRLSDSR
jgi:SAM-dependent methyltransferase